MSTEELEKLCIKAIKEITFKKVDNQTELLKEGILESITAVDVAVMLEEELNIKIPFVDINEQNFSSVQALCQYLTIKLKNNN